MIDFQQIGSMILGQCVTLASDKHLVVLIPLEPVSNRKIIVPFIFCIGIVNAIASCILDLMERF